MTRKKEGTRNPALYTPKAVLGGDWRTFVQKVPHMNELELKKALHYETASLNRPSYVEKLYTKYNSRRSARERRELLATKQSNSNGDAV